MSRDSEMKLLEKIEELEKTVFYNQSSDPIFISRKIIPDAFGGPGHMEQKTIVEPGQGIDISILGLGRRKTNGAN